MTTKRTHGPCTCYRSQCGTPNGSCAPDCPSLYPAQQEPDALARLARYIRESSMHEVEKEEALAIITEIRAEMGTLRSRARS